MARVSLSLVCLCVCVAICGRGTAEAAQGTFAGTSQFTPRFAIADFDGDRKPDLATVQVERDAVIGTRYSIRLQLSAGEESAIGITAPQGGLQLVARDVNGDDAIDLIVVTALDSHFVAVLLNDGHGKFTQAKAGAFPSVENDERVRLAAAQRAADECAPLQVTRSTFGIEALHNSGTGLSHKSKFAPPAICDSNLPDIRPVKSGRSPPSAVFHS